MKRSRLAVVVAFAYVVRRRRREGKPDDLVVLRIAADAELWVAYGTAFVPDADRAVSCRTRREAHRIALQSARRDAVFGERLGLETTIKGSLRGELLAEVRMRHPLIMEADRSKYLASLRARTKVETWDDE